MGRLAPEERRRGWVNHHPVELPLPASIVEALPPRIE